MRLFVRSLFFLWWLGATCCPLVVATAQSQTKGGIALSVHARANGSVRCFDTALLKQRIAYYDRTQSKHINGLRLELYVDNRGNAELRVYRGDAFLSKRRFENLPSDCADRRDAVALSIALALESTVNDYNRMRSKKSVSDSTLGFDIGRDDSVARSNLSGLIEEVSSSGSSDFWGSVDKYESASETSKTNATKTRASSDEDERNKRKRRIPPEPYKDEEPAEDDLFAEDQNVPEDYDEDVYAADDEDGGPIVHLHAGGRWLAEALPSPVWTGALGAELWLSPNFAVDFSVFVTESSNYSFADGRAEAQMTGGEVLGCQAWKLNRFVAQGCLGATAAACWAGGREYPRTASDVALFWAATTGRLALRWPDERTVSLRLLMQSHLSVVRPEMKVEGASERLSPSWVGGLIGLDVIVSLE